APAPAAAQAARAAPAQAALGETRPRVEVEARPASAVAWSRARPIRGLASSPRPSARSRSFARVGEEPDNHQDFPKEKKRCARSLVAWLSFMSIVTHIT